MKSLFLIIPVLLYFLVTQEQESENTIKPLVTNLVKNNKIINIYKHPYYSHYINYFDNLNSLYATHQEKQNLEGC